ncbi:MAG: hypothetical protein N3D73_01395 [Candidatus Diapherotrites archaeon]|nr:hypothetical protein [Candidatus Diapherotrites archaeon]
MLLYFYFVFIELRKVVKKDEFFSYVLFFSALCLSIILAFLLPKIIHSYYSSVLPIFLVMLIYFFFYINAKNICIAKVIYSDKDSAIVEKDFDLLSMTSAGEYKVSSSKRYKKGTTVKVSVKQTLFGKKPDKIISSINE